MGENGSKLYAGLSYEQTVQKYAQNVSSACMMRLQNWADAEDCFQNTFIKLYRKSPDFKFGRTLYVRLFYEGKGSALGDRDPFSDQHCATILSWDADTIHVYYDPKEHGIEPQGGYYRYEIYRQALPGYQAVIVEKSGSVFLSP